MRKWNGRGVRRFRPIAHDAMHPECGTITLGRDGDRPDRLGAQSPKWPDASRGIRQRREAEISLSQGLENSLRQAISRGPRHVAPALSLC